jgi:hypothetical protein
MPGIFVSYRREDSYGSAHRIAELLRTTFGSDQVFMDIDTIEPGVDFVEAVKSALSSCEVLLAVIGPHWLTAATPQGSRRLDDPRDYVRFEVSTALRRKIRVIPVLVGGATSPNEVHLPDEMKPLTNRQAYEVDDKRWKYDSGELVAALRRALGKVEPEHQAATETPGGASPTPGLSSKITAAWVFYAMNVLFLETATATRSTGPDPVGIIVYLGINLLAFVLGLAGFRDTRTGKYRGALGALIVVGLSGLQLFAAFLGMMGLVRPPG